MKPRKNNGNARTASSDMTNISTNDPNMHMDGADYVAAGLATTDDLDARRAEARAEWLARELGSLTDKQRFVLECSWGMRDGVEYSFREIAGLMGIRHQSVKKHYDLAMKALRRAAS